MPLISETAICQNLKAFSKNSMYISRDSGAFNFIKKETLAQVFSCELCEIFKKTFFTSPSVFVRRAMLQKILSKDIRNCIR